MGFITRSGTALVALAGAAVLYALGALCLAAAYVGRTPSDQHIFSELTHAGGWLRFAGAMVALAAVCEASWPVITNRATSATRITRAGRRVLVSPLGEDPLGEDPQRTHVETPREIATDTIIVALGTLLVMLGFLITAANGRTNGASGIIGALGFTMMGLLVLWRSNGYRPELVAGAATLAFAAGHAMVATTTNMQGQVTAGLLQAAAAAAIAGAVVAARPREYLWTGAGRVPFLRPVMGGLLLLTVAFVAAAIVSGVVYSGNATRTDMRVGPAIAYTLEGAGIAMFGWAAAWRVFLANRMQHAR